MMSSFGNAIEEWSTRSTSGISDLRHHLISGDFPGRLSPVRAMAAIVDSAYSSFSGSSYAADYQTSFKHDVCHLNDQQISYMDSEYVKAVYNPSATEHKDLQQHLCCEDSKRYTLSGSEDHFSHKTKRSPTSNSSLCSPDHKISRPYGHDQSPTWVRDSVQGNCSQLCIVSSKTEETSNPKLSSSTFQDFPCENKATLDGVASASDENYTHSQAQKSNKDCFQGLDMNTGKQFTLERINHNNFSENQQKEGRTSKSTRRSWNEFMSEKLRVYKKRAGSWKPAKDASCNNYEGRKCQNEDVQAINQHDKEQYELVPQNIKDTECDSQRKQDLKFKCPEEGTNQTFFSGHKDFCEQPLKSRTPNDLNDIPKSHNLKKDATIKLIPLLSQQQEARPYRPNLCELTSEKITKVSTPMLYHLAGGCNSNLIMMNASNQNKQLNTSKESNTVNQKGHFSVSQMAEPQKPILKTKSQSLLTENVGNEFNEGDAVGSLTSSTEESFMLDYREKLKIAQKKVLRETSFKRRDLQMSLPVRLKLNPSKRPSIDHIRSHSLSSTNQDAKLNSKISSDKDYEKESEKATVSRIGARKRLTKEQKKLCYSEPEKLDHLGVHNSTFAFKNEGLGKNQSGGHRRMKSLDKERTLSSSNLSKTELKQIQHNALVEYMERKANQRPSSVYQSHGQKMSGVQSSPEWKCMTNETQCSDGSSTYYHRRSTGASSSYDATVTWNDRHLKMSLQGENPHPTDKTVKNITSDQCTLENSNFFSMDSCISGSQKNYEPTQAPVGDTAFQTSALHSNNTVSRNRSVTVENTASETMNDFIARTRGKSMEELGIPDIISLSVLSQSSDQIYHIKGSIPVPRPETISGTAVLHQNKLKESRKEPRQISKEDLMGPHRSDVAEMGQEKHSRSQRASVVPSNRDNCRSSPSSLFHPIAAELSPCLQGEDEVFAQLISAENSYSSNKQQEDNKQYTTDEILVSRSVLPGHHAEQSVINPHILSLEPSEEDLPGNDNEVRADVNDLCKSLAVRESPVSSSENQDIEAASEQRATPPDAQSMTNIEQEERDTDPNSQVNRLLAANTFSGNGEHSHSEEAIGQKMKANTLEKRDFAREYMTGVTTKSPTEEKYAMLVKEITSKDKFLMDILNPLPVTESAISLMKSLFHVDISILEKSRNQRQKKEKVNAEGMSKSHSKTMLLLQKKSEECLDEITSKKVELIFIINTELEERFTQRNILLSEISENSIHGSNMEAVVKEVCKANEYERYKMFIGDLEKVVSLLFSLTTRLSRVENALTRADENTDAEDMQSLKERHGLLCRQREDAKDLKDNLDRRELVVTGILAKYLNEAQLEDYKHYVRLKTSFLIELKDLDEKIKFHEEQLESLHNSIPF